MSYGSSSNSRHENSVTYIRAKREHILELNERMGGSAFDRSYDGPYESLKRAAASIGGDHLHLRYVDDEFQNFVTEQSYKNDVMIRTKAGYDTKYIEVEDHVISVSDVACHYDKDTKSQKVSLANTVRAKIKHLGEDVKSVIKRGRFLTQNAGTVALLLAMVGTSGFMIHHNLSNSVEREGTILKVEIERNWGSKRKRWEAHVTMKEDGVVKEYSEYARRRDWLEVEDVDLGAFCYFTTVPPVMGQREDEITGDMDCSKQTAGTESSSTTPL